MNIHLKFQIVSHIPLKLILTSKPHFAYFLWAIAQVLCCQVTSGKLLGQEWRTFIQVVFVVGCGASKKSIWLRKVLDMDMLITCCYMWQVTSQVKNSNVHAFAMDFL